ncbi:hypothetical protein ANCCAN_17976 [Ancylostoma caninum]|uniref:Uncharacterized protein n=1 Tax=Ancylostoma caninum TaxID=29170 RepID=A0A368FYQ9_ANCCA|nr:hypothetical protein ANCCAN_17976 [Ancylostoma caninum]
MFRTLGPTASSLLETNNVLEAEVVRLRNEISCTGIRIRALENELSNGSILRGGLEQELSVSQLNCQKLQQAATKNSQVISSLRTELVGIRKEKDRLVELLKQTEMQLAANSEQVSFLTKRNETLGKKCEELVEKNKILREERDDAAQLATSMKREVENMQATNDLRLVEYKRMESDLATARERERMWKVEKLELERKLNAKDSLLASERKKAEEQKKRDKAQLEQLEKKLKSEQPGWEAQLGVMRPLKEQSCVIATYQMTGGRPPRVLSAPPLPSTCMSETSTTEAEAQQKPDKEPLKKSDSDKKNVSFLLFLTLVTRTIKRQRKQKKRRSSLEFRSPNTNGVFHLDTMYYADEDSLVVKKARLPDVQFGDCARRALLETTQSRLPSLLDAPYFF